MLLYLFLVVFSVVAPAVSQSGAGCTWPSECVALSRHGIPDSDIEDGVAVNPYYYNLLETALLRDSNNLYQLNLALFPASGPRVVKEVQVDMALTVLDLEDHYCASDHGEKTFPGLGETVAYNYRYTYYGEKVSTLHKSYSWQDGSSLRAVARRELSTALFYEGIIALATAFSVLAAPEDLYTSKLSYRSVRLTLTLDRLECNPEMDSTDLVIRHILSGLKQYAIAQGNLPDTWDESNRGEVDVAEEGYQTAFDDTVDKLVQAIFVLINISVMLVVMRATPGLYGKLVDKVSEETKLKKVYCTVYWAGTTVVFLVVITLILADVVALGLLILNPFMFYRSRTTLATAGTLKTVISVVEFGICIRACRGNKKVIDFPCSCFANVYCCCCCCCKCCSRNIKYQVVHILALWAIVSFVQHLVMSAVPLFFIIILYPGEAFSLLATSLSALFCIIMLVSHMFFLYQGYYGTRANRADRCDFVAMFVIQMLMITPLMGVIISIVLLYLVLLGNGATFSGFGGWAVSLIPPAILAVIGWFVKTKLLKSIPGRTPQNGNDNQELIDIAVANE